MRGPIDAARAQCAELPELLGCEGEKAQRDVSKWEKFRLEAILKENQQEVAHSRPQFEWLPGNGSGAGVFVIFLWIVLLTLYSAVPELPDRSGLTAPRTSIT